MKMAISPSTQANPQSVGVMAIPTINQAIAGLHQPISITASNVIDAKIIRQLYPTN